MSFLDGLSENDFKLLDQPTFVAGEKTEFLINKVVENVKPLESGGSKLSVNLLTTIQTGPNAGRMHTLYLRPSQDPIGKEKYIKQLVGLFGKEAVMNKTAKLSDLVQTKISAVAAKPRETADGNVFQDFNRFENLGKVEQTPTNT